MNEELYIEKAALLADKPGAERLDTDRSRKFVARMLVSDKKEAGQSNNFFNRLSVYAWSGVALALAACIAVTFVLFRPASSYSVDDSIVNGYGTPMQLQENSSIHGETELLDSVKAESSDTLIIESVIEQKE